LNANNNIGLSSSQQFLKRSFDVLLSVLLLCGFLVPLVLLIGVFGIFKQQRIGKNGTVFTIYKLETLKETEVGMVPKRFGNFLRKFKIDEWPQLFNVLVGSMSFVGPRPDIQGYADRLLGDDRIILSVKPGITGPATLKYKNEEQLLSKQDNPLAYNDKVLWPDKVKINKTYVKEWSFRKDLLYIWKTIF
jgi:lipopolysaccharide/colanic/teichoic acid biosynthesis glycosyltransferase